MSQRISTGIFGLDERMQGGFVQGSMNLITGKTGTGKTAFSSNFIYQGVYNNQPGVYITTEERAEDLRGDIYEMFGWDLTEFENDGMLEVVSMKPLFPSKEIDNLNRLIRSYISNLMDEINAAIQQVQAERVVIDSISIIEMFIKDEYLSRVALSSLLNNLRGTQATTVLTGTVPETSEGLSGGGIIEFLVDSVLLLEFVPVSEGHSRTLTIRKMRRTDHDVSIMPFEITPDGLEIMDLE
jgi:KaiC/GvpD/RAD55 family RecA-like ATPase